MDTSKRILLIEFCNFEDYPIGGLLSFAKNLMVAFENELVLIGITTSKNEPVGKWFKKNINGITYDVFALARYNTTKTKHYLPDRLVSYFLLKYFRKRILAKGIQNVFIQRPDILQAVKNFGFKNICYRFGGLENPLEFSKYWYAQFAAKFFDKKFFSSFSNVQLILASGDKDSIKQMTARSNGHLNSESVFTFPTRINTQIFRPINKLNARKILNIPESEFLISTTGRLSSIKGWMFMIDCYIEFEKKNRIVHFIL